MRSFFNRTGWRTALALGAGLLLLAGCAHYQLGTGTKLSFSTLYVAPVRNASGLPQAQAIVSTQVRQAFINDGRVALAASPAAADATLEVDLISYSRQAAVSLRTDTGLARTFNVTLNARCTLRDNRTGRVLFANRPLSVTKEVFTDSGQLQAEYQNVPLLAQTLAQDVMHAVLDVW